MVFITILYLETELLFHQVSFRVFSKPHFGGDGFAFWVLSSEMDPSYSAEGKALTGPVFGLRENFKGFGVVFDTYDNDGRRDNPSVFAVMNKENNFAYSHNDDLASSYIRDTPGNLGYKCTADYRNLGKPMRVLFRYFRNVLHVYVDDSIKDRGYKFCLAVNIDLGSAITEKHLAFTAMTGEGNSSVRKLFQFLSLIYVAFDSGRCRRDHADLDSLPDRQGPECQ